MKRLFSGTVARASVIAFSDAWPLSAGIVALVAVFSTAVILPNMLMLRAVFSLEAFGTAEKWNIARNLPSYFLSGYTLGNQVLIILLAVLTAVNVALFVSYLRHRLRSERLAGTGVLGMLLGFLGIGCASCGSVILATVFGMSATLGFLGILPLQGAEFGALGTLLLIFSIFSLAAKITGADTCRIPSSANY